MTTAYCLVLDANIWIAERLLQSSIGNAVLYAIAGSDAFIGLPEIIEREATEVLLSLAEKAVVDIAKQAALLRQLSGQQLSYSAPTGLAIGEGVKTRWQQLEGRLKRIPFSIEHAKSALNRVITKTRPSGDNNEQFRDCCIWEAVLELARERQVHFITNDFAFYEGGDRKRGLAASLLEEVKQTEANVSIYPALRDFLASAYTSTALIDDVAIRTAIVTAIMPRAREMATDHGPFDLGETGQTHIRGYATPRPSLIAISFSVGFKLSRTESSGALEERRSARMTLSGACSYDPNTKEVTEIEIKEWSVMGDHDGPGFWGSFSLPEGMREHSSHLQTRIIS